MHAQDAADDEPVVDGLRREGERGAPGQGPVMARILLELRLREMRRVCSLPGGQTEDGVAGEVIDWLKGDYAPVSLHEVIDKCEQYGISDLRERAALLGLAREANVAGWWDRYRVAIPAWHLPYLGFEQASRLIRAVSVHAVHDLLQTREYACAHIHGTDERLSSAEIEARADLRNARQRLLLHRDDPPHVWVVAEEISLRRSHGGRATMFRQLEHLMDLCDLPRLTVQIIPVDQATAHLPGSFTLLSLGGFSQPGPLPELVCLQHLTTTLYLDSQAEIDDYRYAHHILATKAALPASATQALLRRISREL
ncbi:DUF5753 domain-containing protein [Spirillospora sp. CA-294931]|uniref:DUF5753 domain-containing protein n=1 Tax=Spirillospora sp. CA-294931 TaxID=3240042 RepID=UPI003D8E930D